MLDGIKLTHYPPRMLGAIDAAIRKHHKVTEVVSGGAMGADSLGEAWANRRDKPITRFPADWNQHGKAAGPIRNAQMADYADCLLAVWDGTSRGTADMIEQMRKRGKPVKVVTYEPRRIGNCWSPGPAWTGDRIY